MNDSKKTKQQLITELKHLRSYVQDLEAREAEDNISDIFYHYDKIGEPLSNANWYVLVVDVDWNVMYINRSLQEMLHRSAHSVKNISWIDTYVPEEERQEVLEKFDKMLEKQIPESIQYHVVIENGSQCLVNWYLTPIKQNDGSIKGILAVGEDVTIKNRNIKINSILLNIADAAVQIKDLKSIFSRVRELLSEIIDTRNCIIALYNPARQELSVIRREEKKDKYANIPLGASLTAYVVKTGESLYATEKVIDSLVEQKKVKLYGSKPKIWLGVPIKIRKQVRGVITFQSTESETDFSPDDITMLEFIANHLAIVIDRKRGMEELEDIQEQYSILTEKTGQVLYDYDVISGKIKWTGAIKKVTGYSPVEYQKIDIDKWAALIHPDDKELALKNLDVAQKKCTSYNFEYRLRRKDHTYRYISDHGVFLADAQNKAYRMLGTMIDITKRKRVEDDVRLEKDRAQKYLDVAGVIIIALNTEGIVTLINRKGCQVLGYEKEEVVGKHWFSTFLPERLTQNVESVFAKLMKDGVENVEYFENPVVTKSGQEKMVAWYNTLLVDEGGTVVGTLSSGEDVTSRREAEEALAFEQYLLATLMDSIPDNIYFKDKKSRFIRINQAMAEYVGLDDPAFAIGKTDQDFFMDEHANESITDEQYVMSTRKPIISKVEKEIWPDGQTTWVSTTKVPLYDRARQVIGTIGISRDITKRKRAEDQIIASLKEKELLLKEIHHRVKNNLQIISSLLNLQAVKLKVENPNIADKILETQSRVKSMALIHEKLYQSYDFAKIHFNEYINSLAMYLIQSFNIPTDKIYINVSGGDMQVGIDTAIPCGLIVNELITNALKHAFPDKRTGKIDVEILPGQEVCKFVICDNGIGLPQDFDFRNSESLGLQLVNTLVEQLEGEITLDRSQGTKFIIEFPNECQSK